MQTHSSIENHKIMSMEKEKRNTILNASMSEFSKGFKMASTDLIAQKAGISKGLLFHYFGTKRDLYLFILDYALETVMNEYKILLYSDEKDLLERIWQISLLKKDLCGQYPDIFEFLTASYYQISEQPNDFALRYMELKKELYRLLYDNIDEDLLKENINKVMASNIIRWTLEGLSQKMTHEKKSFKQMSKEFDTYLEETKSYLNLLRELLYR